jgi:hypothetical protein
MLKQRYGASEEFLQEQLNDVGGDLTALLRLLA